MSRTAGVVWMARERPMEGGMPIGSEAPITVPSSSRYSDQPMSLGTRLFGVGGVALVAMAIAGGALFTWTVFHVSKEPTHLTVFDVAAPATPPEPVNEKSPEPEKVQKDRAEPVPDRPIIPPPQIQIPNSSPLPVLLMKPVIDPAPPVKETSAPETKPEPPASQPSSTKPTWEGLVLGALNKAKRYPREASLRRQQGVPYIRFVMDREGKVLSSRIERSSGFRPLDDEAVSLPGRAQPLPKPPAEVKGESIELVVPVEFFIK